MQILLLLFSHWIVSDSLRPHELWPQAPLPWDFTGKNPGVHLLLRGSSQPRGQTHVFQVSCIGRWLLCHWVTKEAHAYIKTCFFPEQCVLIHVCAWWFLVFLLVSLLVCRMDVHFVFFLFLGGCYLLWESDKSCEPQTFSLEKYIYTFMFEVCVSNFLFCFFFQFQFGSVFSFISKYWGYITIAQCISYCSYHY